MRKRVAKVKVLSLEFWVGLLFDQVKNVKLLKSLFLLNDKVISFIIPVKRINFFHLINELIFKVFLFQRLDLTMSSFTNGTQVSFFVINVNLDGSLGQQNFLFFLEI